MPSNFGAVLTTALQRPFEIKEVPYPTVGEGQVIIKTHAVAINYIDQAIQDLDIFKMQYPMIVGLDVAGEIVEVGSGVEGLKKGQRVLAGTDYLTLGAASGTFQNYCLTTARTVTPIPDNLSFERASVAPLGLVTAAFGLYHSDQLGLPLPTHDSKPTNSNNTILVWGGSGTCGSNTIQLAKASGYNVITTASPGKNFDLCKKLGASQVFDRNSEDVVEQITSHIKSQNKKLIGIYDSIAKPPVQANCRALAKSFGLPTVASVLPWNETEPDEQYGIKYTGGNAGLLVPTDICPQIFHNWLPKALENGSYYPNPDPKVVNVKGLEGCQVAIDEYREKGVSGEKLVVKII